MQRQALAFVMLFLAGCTLLQQGRQHEFQGAYGSIAYRVSVNRQVDGANYVYRVSRLDLTLDPRAAVNATHALVHPSVRFLARTSAMSVAFEASIATDIRLDAEHPSATLHDLRFVVPKSAVLSARYAGLDLSDGHLLWPFFKNLRD